jgi:hypothetical protein
MKCIMVTLSILVALSLTLATEHNFSGNWVLDQEYGVVHENPYVIDLAGKEIGISITLTENGFYIENRCIECGNIKRGYVTDGTVRKRTNVAGTDISYSARWKEDNLIIYEVSESSTPFGATTFTNQQTWALSSDKHVLTVSSTAQTAQGNMSITQVYRKSL